MVVVVVLLLGRLLLGKGLLLILRTLFIRRGLLLLSLAEILVLVVVLVVLVVLLMPELMLEMLLRLGLVMRHGASRLLALSVPSNVLPDTCLVFLVPVVIIARPFVREGLGISWNRLDRALSRRGCRPCP